MNLENTNEINLESLLKKSLEEKIEDTIPNFRKKNAMTEAQVEKIIGNLSFTLGITPERVLIGMMLLFLQGATSAGAPLTMSIDLGEGKILTKKNIVDACNMTAQHQYIRRIAETLSAKIGEFALKNKLPGELAYRINNRNKAETGNNLSELEMAYCSSFSQNIPNLAEVTSERLAKLLAEDYQRRFEGKRKNTSVETNKSTSRRKTPKPKRRR